MDEEKFINDLRAQLSRKATVFEVGGFRPSGDLLESSIGKVKIATAEETWPHSNGKPLLPLCQLDLTAVPFKPAGLSDLEFLTVFISGSELPLSTPNGIQWCVRAYTDKLKLIPLSEPEQFKNLLKPFPLKPKLIENDYPCWENLPNHLYDCFQEMDEEYYDFFQTADGLKLGGWPSLIQSEIYWAPNNQHPAKPEYVFQIDSEPKANWSWGHDGVGYFGLGTTHGHENDWFLEWQCL